MRDRVFSGARPTGRQHIGNYLGAIQNYVSLQAEYDCIYCVVDLHALTTLEDTGSLRDNVNEMVLDWLAAGMDPQQSIIFVQSHVPEVTELHVFFSMITPMGRLVRVPTFKEKVRQHPDNVNYGLLGYPVLQAADILLYKATVVPVGQDQLSHLELTREIARRFNNIYQPIFPEPQAQLTSFPLVIGIDGAQKMSKSLGNHLELSAPPEETSRRVMSMVTDPARVYRTDPGHPEVCNVFTLHGFYSSEQVRDIEAQCRGAEIGCVQCKRLLANHLNDSLAPFRARRAEFAAKPGLVQEVLWDGARRARAIARDTMTQVRESVGLTSMPSG